jgi:hypothetical protein
LTAVFPTYVEYIARITANTKVLSVHNDPRRTEARYYRVEASWKGEKARVNKIKDD